MSPKYERRYAAIERRERERATKDKVVFIPVEGEVQEFYPETFDAAMAKLRELTNDAITDHFRGEYEGEVGLFFVDDTGFLDGLPVNPRATAAYHKCCWPGTPHSIHGDAVGLFGAFAE